MAEQRLPIVNGDDGQWGTILNQYLKKEHYDSGSDNAANGQHMSVTIRAPSASTTTTLAPLRFTSDTLLTGTNRLAGGVEYLSGALYFTTTDNTAQKKFAWTDFSNIEGTLGISNGGTGQTTAAAALNALGGLSKQDYTQALLLGGM